MDAPMLVIKNMFIKTMSIHKYVFKYLDIETKITAPFWTDM